MIGGLNNSATNTTTTAATTNRSRRTSREAPTNYGKGTATAATTVSLLDTKIEYDDEYWKQWMNGTNPWTRLLNTNITESVKTGASLPPPSNIGKDDQKSSVKVGWLVGKWGSRHSCWNHVFGHLDPNRTRWSQQRNG
jgi:hypothetical protein